MKKSKPYGVAGFGPHLTIDGYNCDQEKLADQRLVYQALNELPAHIGMSKMTLPYVCPWKDEWATQENGCSGFVMICESHISIHTFVEENFFTADIYSCKGFDTEKAINFLKEKFGIQEMEINLLQRGTRYKRIQQQAAPKKLLKTKV